MSNGRQNAPTSQNTLIHATMVSPEAYHRNQQTIAAVQQAVDTAAAANEAGHQAFLATQQELLARIQAGKEAEQTLARLSGSRSGLITPTRPVQPSDVLAPTHLWQNQPVTAAGPFLQPTAHIEEVPSTSSLPPHHNKFIPYAPDVDQRSSQSKRTQNPNQSNASQQAPYGQSRTERPYYAHPSHKQAPPPMPHSYVAQHVPSDARVRGVYSFQHAAPINPQYTPSYYNPAFQSSSLSGALGSGNRLETEHAPSTVALDVSATSVDFPKIPSVIKPPDAPIAPNSLPRPQIVAPITSAPVSTGSTLAQTISSVYPARAVASSHHNANAGNIERGRGSPLGAPDVSTYSRTETQPVAPFPHPSSTTGLQSNVPSTASPDKSVHLVPASQHGKTDQNLLPVPSYVQFLEIAQPAISDWTKASPPDSWLLLPPPAGGYHKALDGKIRRFNPGDSLAGVNRTTSSTSFYELHQSADRTIKCIKLRSAPEPLRTQLNRGVGHATPDPSPDSTVLQTPQATQPSSTPEPSSNVAHVLPEVTQLLEAPVQPTNTAPVASPTEPNVPQPPQSRWSFAERTPNAANITTLAKDILRAIGYRRKRKTQDEPPATVESAKRRQLLPIPEGHPELNMPAPVLQNTASTPLLPPSGESGGLHDMGLHEEAPVTPIEPAPLNIDITQQEEDPKPLMDTNAPLPSPLVEATHSSDPLPLNGVDESMDGILEATVVAQVASPSDEVPQVPQDDQEKRSPGVPLFFPSPSISPVVGGIPFADEGPVLPMAKSSEDHLPTAAPISLDVLTEASTVQLLRKNSRVTKRVHVLVPPAPYRIPKTSKPTTVMGKFQDLGAEGSAAIQRDGIFELIATRLCLRECRWLDCDAQLNSINNLEKHVMKHVEEISDSKTFHCGWNACPLDFPDEDKLRSHMKRHLHRSLMCPFKGCHETFDSSGAAYLHIMVDHTRPISKPKPSVAPFRPTILATLPPMPEYAPTYMTVPCQVRPASITPERHAHLGPWVLKNILGPVGQGAKLYRATMPLRSVARPVDMNDSQSIQERRYDEYGFLALFSSHGKSASAESRRVQVISHFEDLKSRDISKLVHSGVAFLEEETDELESDDSYSGLEVAEEDSRQEGISYPQRVEVQEPRPEIFEQQPQNLGQRPTASVRRSDNSEQKHTPNQRQEGSELVEMVDLEHRWTVLPSEDEDDAIALMLRV